MQFHINFGRKSTQIPRTGIYTSGLKFLQLNNVPYVLSRDENGKIYFTNEHVNHKFYTDDEVLNNLIIGNYKIINDDKYSVEEAREGFNKYVVLLVKSKVDIKSSNYIGLVKMEIYKKEKVPPPEMKEIHALAEAELRQDRRGRLKKDKEVQSDTEEDRKSEFFVPGEGFPKDLISMFAYLYKYIAAKKAGHDGLDDNIRNIMKKLKQKKLLTKEKQVELMKKVFEKKSE